MRVAKRPADVGGQASRPRSVIAWEGPSLFTGAPVQVVLTGLDGSSQNEKTGPMVHAWVLHAGRNSSKALGSPFERDVCGDCPLQGVGSRRPCYVAMGLWLVEQHREKYPTIDTGEVWRHVRHAVRVTAYGDPAAVPFEVWEQLVFNHAPGWTGYTHAWRTCDQRLRSYLMASVDSPGEAATAREYGWRTFRVREPGGAVDMMHEVLCPAESHEAQCVDCRLCVGAARDARSVVITVHGKGSAEWLRQKGF